jgi:predicted nucleic acid-binding protein
MISGPVVVDASVAVEFLVELGLTRHACRFFTLALGPDSESELWAPDLIYSESASALRKLVRLHAIAARSAARAIGQLVRLLPIAAAGTAALMPRVWALRGVLTSYDACYVALAERLQAPLVTADRRLARAQLRNGPRVVFVGDLDR